MYIRNTLHNYNISKYKPFKNVIFKKYISIEKYHLSKNNNSIRNYNSTIINTTITTATSTSNNNNNSNNNNRNNHQHQEKDDGWWNKWSKDERVRDLFIALFDIAKFFGIFHVTTKYIGIYNTLSMYLSLLSNNSFFLSMYLSFYLCIVISIYYS
jgi:hypothetical protein